MVFKPLATIYQLYHCGSTNKTDWLDIIQILLKIVLNLQLKIPVIVMNHMDFYKACY